MADEPKIIVNGKEYAMPDSFTLGELADMEKITGQGYDLGKGGPLAGLALAYIAIRRVEASVTLDLLRDLAVEDVSFTGNDVVPPGIGAQKESAPSSKPGSADGSEPTPAKTLAHTGTD